MRLIKIIIICLAGVLTGCASGIKYQDLISSIPPVKPDKGRIFFYRNSSFVGAAVQPSIILDGEKIGDSRPNGFFYVDRMPGKHVVTVTTEVQNKRTFELARGEIKYVKTAVEMGAFVGHVTADVMYPETATEDLLSLAYIGDKIGAHGGETVVVQQARDSTDQKTISAPQIPADDNAERWSGLMSCDARKDDGPRNAAYQAIFAMEVSGNSVNVHRQTAQAAETLSGKITDNMLELYGEGYRIEAPARKWQFKISGPLQPGAPIYAGTGNMLVNGKAVRACELTMTRSSKPA